MITTAAASKMTPISLFFCLVMMSSSKNSVLCVQSVKVMNQLLAPLDPPFPSISSSPSPQKALLPDQMQTKITLGQTHSLCGKTKIRVITFSWFHFCKGTEKIETYFDIWENKALNSSIRLILSQI